MNFSDKRIRTLLVLAVLAVAVVVAGVLGLRGGTDSGSGSGQSVAASATAKPTAKADSSTSAPTRVAGVPERAYRTLVEIDAGRWPDSAGAPGTKGGDQWMNREGTLARTDSSGKAIAYKEWDVNPKKRGQTRDAERIVTGSDGSAYYTGDHYETFTRMR